MLSHRLLMARTIPLFVLFAILSAWGCNCGDGPVRDDPITIKFLYPTGGEIDQGRIRVRVEDLNKVERVEFYIGKKKIGTKTAGEKTTFVTTQQFDLNAQPDAFTIRVVAFDINGEKAEKKLPVRKIQDVPKIRFLKPTKLLPSHSKIFVGKKFTIQAEASHLKGIKEIVVNLFPKPDQKELLKQCSTETTANKWVRCELQADLSDPKYKDGDFVLKADATSTSNKKPEREAIMQFTLDKTGPRIAFLSPPANSNLRGKQLIRIKLRDQVGVDPAKIFIFVNNKKLVPAKKGQEEWSVEFDFTATGSANVVIKATAVDLLGNPSEQIRKGTSGCRTDNDCISQPGTRCCLVNSPVNKDGSKTGQCFPVKTKEGEICDPCTNPCGRGSDGKLMGCLPGACNRPPYQCRRACNSEAPHNVPTNATPSEAICLLNTAPTPTSPRSTLNLARVLSVTTATPSSKTPVPSVPNHPTTTAAPLDLDVSPLMTTQISVSQKVVKTTVTPTANGKTARVEPTAKKACCVQCQ